MPDSSTPKSGPPTPPAAAATKNSSVTPTPPSGSRRNSAILITGAGGEVGHGLIRRLHSSGGGGGAGGGAGGGRTDLVAMDLRELEPALKSQCRETLIGDICDWTLLERLHAHYEIEEIYHLAALLSTRSEFSPEAAHEVNVKGTLNLLRLAAEQARAIGGGRRVRFLFPSSIAVYGLPDLRTKAAAGAVTENQWCMPTTMYGCNKLYCEHLGRYYAHHYRQLAKDRIECIVDFRAIRFPGIISADTVPSGGTSDYAPEMIHAAAQGRPYACFVREDTRIPFMTMPDAIDALLALASAPQNALTRTVYNVTSFNPSAAEIAAMVRERFKGAQISFKPDVQRQAIVDSWPADTDDSAARRDWGYSPRHDLDSAFDDYLVPAIKARYA